MTWFIFNKFGGNSNGFFYKTCIVITTILFLSTAKDFCGALHAHNGLGIVSRCIEVFLLIGFVSFIIIKENQKVEGVLPKNNLPLNYILLVFIILLTVREAFQMVVNLTKYLFSKENWAEILIIGLIYYILYDDMWRSHKRNNGNYTGEGDHLLEDLNEDDDTELSRILSGFVIVLSWSDFIVLFGKHPSLTR